MRHRGGGRLSRAAAWPIAAFVLVYAAVVVVWRAPLWPAGLYLALSVVTVFAYAFDKTAAERGTWRTPESHLHLLALAGGWPGALLAQQVLRQKSAKRAFRQVFWLTLALNVAGFVALCSPLAGPWRLH